MSDTVIISWNFTNWVTIILMAVLGWAVYKLIVGFMEKRRQMAEG